ncbi:hypothetical protein [Flavobacterium sp.]|uniref:hypothetical protein n=1 Tax=Flavobacterium sp. TaxID=239 RepID=UPI003D6B8A0D
MDVYDLNNSAYLSEDIENVIDRIGKLYEIRFLKDKIEFTSKIMFPENASWVSDETTKVFNEAIPVIKSIITDIYSILEGIFVFKNGEFDKPKEEKKYKYLKELREFNNKLKHHNTKKVVFNLTSIININQKTLDCIIQYKYDTDAKIKILSLVQFFQLFFVIMEAEKIIELERK